MIRTSVRGAAFSDNSVVSITDNHGVTVDCETDEDAHGNWSQISVGIRNWTAEPQTANVTVHMTVVGEGHGPVTSCTPV